LFIGCPYKSAGDIIERNCCSHKILKVTFLRNDAWNVRCDAVHVEIGYVVPLQYKNNIFWIFKTAISRNYGKWMATCGMSDNKIPSTYTLLILLDYFLKVVALA